MFFRVLALFSLIITAAVALFPELAWAQSASIEPTIYDNNNFSSLFERITNSFEGGPGLVAIGAYGAGIILAITGLIKLKDHIDSPRDTPLREPLARLLIGGALFALPTIIETVTRTIGTQAGDIAPVELVNGAVAINGVIDDGECSIKGGLDAVLGGNIFDTIMANTGTIGSTICLVAQSFEGLPGLISAILYMAGIVITVWALFQLKEHIINPDRSPVSAPLKKLIVAGIFFAFPSFIQITADTFNGGGNGLGAYDPFAGMVAEGGGACVAGAAGAIAQAVGWLINLIGEGAAPTNNVGGLDCMMIRLVSDIWGPTQLAISIFCYIAGMICVALAVRRFMDGMDKGVRGPLGTGTFALLALGGALMSINTIFSVVSLSLFPTGYDLVGMANDGPSVKLYGALAYTPGVGKEGQNSMNAIITTVFAFSFLVGMISIIRGMFIIKEVSDGGNASLMAGFTHLLGGGLAMNLGMLITVIQNTLGLQSVGLKVASDPISADIGGIVGGIMNGGGGGILGAIGSIF